MACDICGCNNKPLSDLLDNYQTEDIKQVCPECGEILNKQLRKIKRLTTGLTGTWFKQFMNNLKGKL